MAQGEKLRELGGQLASGGLASAIAKTCVAPFDRTKILLQTSDVIAKSTPGHRSYTGVFDAFRRIPQEQGLSSFWRGNLTNCSRVVPTYALRFTFFDRIHPLGLIEEFPFVAAWRDALMARPSVLAAVVPNFEHYWQEVLREKGRWASQFVPGAAAAE